MLAHILGINIHSSTVGQDCGLCRFMQLSLALYVLQKRGFARPELAAGSRRGRRGA